MTNTTETEFLVTSCPNHGVRVTSDFYSALVYVEAALVCLTMLLNTDDHALTHLDQTDCWVCCDQMVIDPHGMFDY